MTLGIAYWVLLLIWLVLGVFPTWSGASKWPFGGGIVLFILLVIIGLKLFPFHS